MRINILITTYNRPEKLRSLVSKLNNQELQGEIIVYNDGSSMHYGKFDATHFKFPYNHGKKKYYKLVNALFNARGNADLYIMIPDDAHIDDNFIRDAVNSWNDIKDPKKICLNLLADNREECWTKFKRQKQGKFYLTQWNDCCFIAENNFFEEIGEINVNPNRWNKNKMLGSGVGNHISQTLHSRGWNMYQVIKTLVHHGDHDSVMNYEARKKNPIKT